MFGIIEPATYIAGAVAVIVLPGPNSMYCLTVAGRHGIAPAYRAVAGILLGDSLLMLATVLGAGTLLKAHPALFHSIKLAGGLYLAYIGANLLRGAAKKWYAKPSQTVSDGPKQNGTPHIFKRALLLSLTNPKAILFFLSFFVQFVDPAYPNPALSFLVLAAVLQLVSFAYLNLLVSAGRGLAHAFRRHTKISAAAMGAAGILFIGFAIKMWVAAV